MTWLRLDDGFPEHRKLIGLKRADRWTWIEILSYCARQNNCGKLPPGLENHLKYVTKPLLQRYAAAGLLDEENGLYTVHDWDDYNPRDPTNADRQRRYRNAHSNAPVTEPVTVKVTPPSRPVLLTNKEPAPIPEPVPNKDEPGQGRSRAGEIETVGPEALRLLATLKSQL